MKYILDRLFLSDFPVTQIYGANPDYYKQFGLPGHEGVDYGTPDGTPILAPFDGVVLRDTFADKDYGNFTVVWDSKQLCAVWFCHLQNVTTSIGDQVTRGQILGHTNNTGNTSGPHCHVNFVETDANGNRLNKDNRYQGFLNILDPHLVTFSSTPQPDLQAQLTAKNKEYDELYAAHQDSLHTISQNKDVIANQQVLIEQKNADITALNTKVATLETRVTGLQQQITTLEPIAKQVPVLNQQIADQQTLISQSDIKAQNLRNEITTLAQSNAQLKNSSAWGISKKELLQIFIKRLVGATQ